MNYKNKEIFAQVKRQADDEFYLERTRARGTDPEVVPLHTRLPVVGRVTYTPEEMRRIMGEAILAEREACAQIAEAHCSHWQTACLIRGRRLP